MPQYLAILPDVGWAAASAGVQSEVSASTNAAKSQKSAQEAALAMQDEERKKLEADAALAPEREREAELDKRRRRVKTLLSSQEETGMASVGTKVLLGQ